ncbi:MAG: 3-phosphoshikimate 1-carboxyvinyltransferase [Clostridia bacterium]|nr:3-phosphoshikimate 1-carboxyvinyltransferase [Clostridia bacterium]
MDIRIEPQKLSGNIRAISSKSDVHRFLMAAALANGTSAVHFTTLSDDISATVSVLSAMGAKIDVSGKDGDYTATICGIKKMPANTVLDANECGTTARLILPIAAALTDSFTITGKNGLLKRPFLDLCYCLAQNGTTCSDTHLPITASGKLTSGIYKIRGDVSSQYISGLLFALPLLDGDSEIVLTTPLVSAGYIAMTVDTLSRFGIEVDKTENGYKVKGNQTYRAVADYTAEGDWSNGTFWIAAGVIGGDITVNGLDTNSYQKDKDILKILTRAFATFKVYCNEEKSIRAHKSSFSAVSFNGEDIPDALPALATVLSLAEGKSVISGGARLKIKESDRIATTASMLKALGADIEGTDDGFVINGVSHFTGGEIDAANDHRIAMCAAIASQRATGEVIIRGAECVNKSYPTFFEDFEKLGGRYSVTGG